MAVSGGKYDVMLVAEHDLCPPELEAYLKKEAHRWPSYDDIKQEIHEYVARTKRPASGGVRAFAEAHGNNLGDEELEASDGIQADEELAEVLDPEDLDWIPVQHRHRLLAIVKNVHGKASKGKGKVPQGP